MTTQTPLYVDVHVLQTVPPSNLNRDDAGSPKQAMYGGARRARVSSQAWKRATRTHFAQSTPTALLGTRTKRLEHLIGGRLAERSGLETDQAQKVVRAALKSMGLKAGKKEHENSYLLFLGHAQVERIVDLLADDAGELAALSEGDLVERVKALPIADQLSQGHPIDVALFGRMVADISALNVDAATQVAHAISTHAVEREIDYFTAVDDENPEGAQGAGMIGTVEFNSATLYRFATVGVHQLLENLDGDVDTTFAALQAFVESFTRSMPTGHQTSFAHRTMPNLVTLALRDDQPVNLVSAFETPVRSTNGHVHASISQFAAEFGRATEVWGLRPLAVHSTPTSTSLATDEVAALGRIGPFDDVLRSTLDAVRQRLVTGITE